VFTDALVNFFSYASMNLRGEIDFPVWENRTEPGEQRQVWMDVVEKLVWLLDLLDSFRVSGFVHRSELQSHLGMLLSKLKILFFLEFCFSILIKSLQQIIALEQFSGCCPLKQVVLACFGRRDPRKLVKNPTQVLY
jgi:hypothetical protein